MLRSLLRLLVAATTATALAGQAHAFSPEGGTAPITDFGGRHGFSFAVFGVDTTKGPCNDALPLHTRVATAGLTWARAGWSVGVAGGPATFALPGQAESAARLVGVSVGREMANIAGGTLAAEFRAHRLYADETSTDLMAASLRWSRKF